MVKKRRATGRRRKKSNTEEQSTGAKRSKVEAAASDVKNRLISAIIAMIDSMNEEHLYSVMVYAGAVGKELIGSDKAAAETSAAKAIESSAAEAAAATTTTTTTTEIAGAKTTTTTTTRGVPTGSNGQTETTNSAQEDSTPTTPQPPPVATPPPIRFTREMRPAADTIVKIVPHCFHFGRTENKAQVVRRRSVQIIVDAIVNINLSKEEQALALQQAILHPLVRSIAKSAGLADNNNYMIKNYIMNNVKSSVKLALKTNSAKGRANDDLRSLAQSVVLSSMKSTQEQLEDKENGVFVPSSQQIANTIGIPKTTFQRIRKLNQERRDLACSSPRCREND